MSCGFSYFTVMMLVGNTINDFYDSVRNQMGFFMINASAMLTEFV